MEIYISRNGSQEGPFTLEGVNELLKNGIFNADDFAWFDGLSDWIAVKDVPNIELPKDSLPTPLPEILATEHKVKKENNRKNNLQKQKKLIYEYEAYDAQGEIFRDSIEAANSKDAKNLIRNRGLSPKSVWKNTPLPQVSPKTFDRQILTSQGRVILNRWGIREIQIPKNKYTSKCVCPKCNSDSVQKASVLCEHGTKTYSSSSLGVGVAVMGSDHLAPIVARGINRGVVKSELAKRLAPPSTPQTIQGRKTGDTIMSVSLFVIWAIINLFIWFFLAISAINGEGSFLPANIIVLPLFFGGLLIYNYDSFKNVSNDTTEMYEKDYAILKNQWNNSWYCHKCGYFGLLDA